MFDTRIFFSLPFTLNSIQIEENSSLIKSVLSVAATPSHTYTTNLEHLILGFTIVWAVNMV